MKLAYRVYIVTLILLAFVFAVSAQVVTTPSNARSAKDDRNTAPTVGTGGPIGGPTGLFTVYDGQTLRRGEYTFSAAYSNYDRDPGNFDITEVPLSFQIGLTNRIELFFTTDGYRAVKSNSPRNVSSYYLPNSGIFGLSGPAIVLAPSGPGAGSREGFAVYRPTGTAPFVQYPYTGGNAGNFGLSGGAAGPLFGFPIGNPLLGPPVAGGEGADNFPGVGSVFGSILPGVVLQTQCQTGPNTVCAPAATIPTVFALAPSYLNDAPFVNRSFGESAFNSFTGGVKWRWTGLDNPVGVGIIGWYKWYADNADDFSGFNQLQRGASPGGNWGDIGVTLFADARVKPWMNISGNVGYVYTSNPKLGDFTLLDRGDELQAAVGVDFPINKYIQPIFEFRTLQYVGGRTPNAFENNPMDALAGLRIFPARWFGFGFAYRYHANEQDEGSFNDEDTFSSNVFVPGRGTVTTTWSGVPPGFQLSENPHGYIVQAFIGRRNKRLAEVVNQFANVTALNLSDTTIKGGCPPGTRPAEGESCNETSISVTTTAVDPENDVLTYNYTVSGGRIVGTGASVTWDLTGAAPGTYTITAGVDDGCGLCGKTETRTITVEECRCVTVCECPSISVSGPAGLTAVGQSMTFTANVSGGSWTPTTYNWTVSAGTISSGQGTSSITVDTTGVAPGSNVTATVDIGPSPADCPCTTTASETAGIAEPPTAPLIDEIDDQPADVIRGRLDTFFAELQNNPDNQGYIINYGTDAQITRRERLIRNHIAFRQFDASRITMVRGGDLGTGPRSKLYRVPPGAANPTP